MKKVHAALLLLGLVTNSVQQHCRKYTDQVLLVSMDGFRWDYVNKVDTPNFDRMSKEGSKAIYINNTFVTKTFPCHYTIVTGLYEESHGIVANTMYDPEFAETFSMKNKESKWWNEGEPLWITVKKNNLKSGTIFWPGSETEIQGIRPDKWLAYDESMQFQDRIDMAIDWLQNKQLNFVTLYFHEPDQTGHAFGPESPQIRDKVSEMDMWLGKLLKQLQEKKLMETVNLIVTSDHGMTTIDLQNKLVDVSPLAQYYDLTLDDGPIMQFIPKTAQADVLVNELNKLDHVTAYKKGNIPEYWHYTHNRRIMPVLAVAEEGWTITTNANLTRNGTDRGEHGYDNRLQTMKPIFYARGPNIRKDFTIAPFNSVDIYALVCELLGIPAAPNNGTLANTEDLLKPFNDVQICSSGGKMSNGVVLLISAVIIGHLFD